MYADFNYLNNDNICYTVDMLRLRTNLTAFEFSKLEFMINTVYKDIVKDTYQSTGISNFKYNYVIQLKENSSYWFGFIHNSELTNANSSMQNEKREYNFTVEFNPNKVENRGLLRYILHLSKNWIIKSIDMAMDIKVNILDICRS